MALNRRIEELIHNKWILDGLLLSLKTSGGDDLVNILNLINTDASMPELAEFMSNLLIKASQSSVKHSGSPLSNPQHLEQVDLSRYGEGTERNDSSNVEDSDDSDPSTLSLKLKGFARAATPSKKGKPAKLRRHGEPAQDSVRSQVQRQMYERMAVPHVTFDDYTPSQTFPFPITDDCMQHQDRTSINLGQVVHWLKRISLRPDGGEANNDLVRFGEFSSTNF